MTVYLKQSTASQEVPLGPFVDSTDGVTAETALTIANTDIKIWVTGATTLANKNSGGATHISGGIYYATLDATDTATLGPLKLFVAVSGALACVLECCVLAANVYDSLIGGGDTLDVQVTGIGANVITAASIAADAITDAKVAADVTIASVTGNVGGNVTGSIGSLATQAKADVNAEVVDCLNTDTYAEPGQGSPGATISLAAKLGYIFKAWRNRTVMTATEYQLYADNGTTKDQEAAVSDNGTQFERAEIQTGA